MKFKTLLLLLVFPCVAFSDITEEGVGIIYGKEHGYSFKAPSGWVLDNESGVNRGIYAIFYPAGETWKDSPVVAYSREISKDDKVNDIASLVEETVQGFHANGSPAYFGEFHKTIKATDSDRTGDIYFFRGDKWGNYEAVGYFEEKSTINIVVLNSRSKALFEASLPKFYELVESYIFLTGKTKVGRQFNNDLQ